MLNTTLRRFRVRVESRGGVHEESRSPPPTCAAASSISTSMLATAAECSGTLRMRIGSALSPVGVAQHEFVAGALHSLEHVHHFGVSSMAGFAANPVEKRTHDEVLLKTPKGCLRVFWKEINRVRGCAAHVSIRKVSHVGGDPSCEEAKRHRRMSSLLRGLKLKAGDDDELPACVEDEALADSHSDMLVRAQALLFVSASRAAAIIQDRKQWDSKCAGCCELSQHPDLSIQFYRFKRRGMVWVRASEAQARLIAHVEVPMTDKDKSGSYSDLLFGSSLVSYLGWVIEPVEPNRCLVTLYIQGQCGSGSKSAISRKFNSWATRWITTVTDQALRYSQLDEDVLVTSLEKPSAPSRSPDHRRLVQQDSGYGTLPIVQRQYTQQESSDTFLSNGSERTLIGNSSQISSETKPPQAQQDPGTAKPVPDQLSTSSDRNSLQPRHRPSYIGTLPRNGQPSPTKSASPSTPVEIQTSPTAARRSLPTSPLTRRPSDAHARHVYARSKANCLKKGTLSHSPALRDRKCSESSKVIAGSLLHDAAGSKLPMDSQLMRVYASTMSTVPIILAFLVGAVVSRLVEGSM